MLGPRNQSGSDDRTLPPVVLSDAFVGLLQGEVALIRPSVKGGDGLMSAVLIQNFPILDEAPF